MQAPERTSTPTVERSAIERPDRYERALDLAAGVLALAFLGFLAAQAGAARFFTDECFHAYVARWIGEHGRLPRTLPELYSGLYYSYPPLFHVLGAAWIRLAGLSALPYLNLVVTGGLFATLAFAGRGVVPRAARRWAVLACVGNAAIATYALRFYAEALAIALTAWAAVCFLRLVARAGRSTAIGLGVAIGLAVTAKLSGLSLLALPLGAAIAGIRRGDRRLAQGGWLALAVAILVALPALARNQVLFGSALYPAFAPDVDPQLFRLHLATFGLPAAEFYVRAAAAIGIAAPALALAGLVLPLATRRPIGAAGALVLFGLVVLAVAPLAPIHDVRHVLPLIPLLALAGGAALVPHASVGLRRLVEGLLLLQAVVTLSALPGLRARLDPPPFLAPALAAVSENTAPADTVLSVWTYDTLYHTGRASTWPIPWGQADRPIEMFRTRDPDAFLAALDRHHIAAMLVPLSSDARELQGSEDPRAFVECAAALIQQGQLVVAWRSDRLALLVRPH